MDPVTVAGLALAVRPLIVTVFEDYKAAIQPFLMLRHSQRQAKVFGANLSTGDAFHCFQAVSTQHHFVSFRSHPSRTWLGNAIF